MRIVGLVTSVKEATMVSPQGSAQLATTVKREPALQLCRPQQVNMLQRALLRQSVVRQVLISLHLDKPLAYLVPPADFVSILE